VRGHRFEPDEAEGLVARAISRGFQPSRFISTRIGIVSSQPLLGSKRASLTSTLRPRSRRRNALSAARSGLAKASGGRPLGTTTGFTPRRRIWCFM
jgi:hypothetical protein